MTMRKIPTCGYGEMHVLTFPVPKRRASRIESEKTKGAIDMEAEMIQWWQALAKRSYQAHAESGEHVAACVEAVMAAEIALGLREHNELLAKQKKLLESLKLRLGLVTEKP
jgi:hypothetical protein